MKKHNQFGKISMVKTKIEDIVVWMGNVITLHLSSCWHSCLFSTLLPLFQVFFFHAIDWQSGQKRKILLIYSFNHFLCYVNFNSFIPIQCSLIDSTIFSNILPRNFHVTFSFCSNLYPNLSSLIAHSWAEHIHSWTSNQRWTLNKITPSLHDEKLKLEAISLLPRKKSFISQTSWAQKCIFLFFYFLDRSRGI